MGSDSPRDIAHKALDGLLPPAEVDLLVNELETHMEAGTANGLSTANVLTHTIGFLGLMSRIINAYAEQNYPPDKALMELNLSWNLVRTFMKRVPRMGRS